MDAELYGTQSRRLPRGGRSGLVDRLYQDQLGAVPEEGRIPDEMFMAQDTYAQQVGPGAGIMRGLDDWLTANVVEPAARAGYPNAGAAAATVPSTMADLIIPQTAGDYAGALIPFGKVGKAARSTQKGIRGLTKEEQAAKRMAENKQVMESLRREKQSGSELAEEEPLSRGEIARRKLDVRGREKERLDAIPDEARAYQTSINAAAKHMLRDQLDVSSLSDDQLHLYAKAASQNPRDLGLANHMVPGKYKESEIQISNLNRAAIKAEAVRRGLVSAPTGGPWIEYIYGTRGQ